MRPALLAAALLTSLLAPVRAQGPTAVTVDGRPLPAVAVVRVDGQDAEVVAAAFLRLSGAVIQGGDRYVEAWFPGGVLSLSAGSDGYQWNAMPGRLSGPTTASPDGEIVARASDLGRILGMDQEGLAFSTRASAALQRRGAMPGLAPASAAAPGLLPVPLDTAFSDATVYDEPAPSPLAEGGDVPGDVPPPAAAAAGRSGPPSLVSFRATPDPRGYRLEVVVCNPGATPVEVQYLETGSTDDAFRIMGSDLVATGQQVTLQKVVAPTPPAPRFRVMLLTLAPSGPPLVVGSLDATP